MLTTILTTRLRELLNEIRSAGGEVFSGIGVLVTNAPDDLPIMPLRSKLKPPIDISTTKLLTEISRFTCDYHDGFHVLSSDLRVSRLSVYFSPPIVREAAEGPRVLGGGRYWAALFGSALPTVLATGVASTHYGVAVFEGGREVHDL